MASAVFRPSLHRLYVTDSLTFAEMTGLHGDIGINATDDLTPSYPVFDYVTGVTVYSHGLSDNATGVHQPNTVGPDSFTVGEMASCRLIPVSGLTASASDIITLASVAGIQGESDTIQLGDMAFAYVTKPATDSLTIGETITLGMIRNLYASDVLVVDDSFFSYVPYELAKREYNPFIGKGTKGNPAPPPTSLAQNLESGKFSLYYPPSPHAPADIVVLRKPEFGNKDRLQFNRISRETRGGTLIVFADPMWPKTQTLVLTFAALRPDQAFNLQRFMETYLGLEIGLTDWEGRQWTGVITNPNDPVVQDSKYSYTASLAFEGQLVSDLVGQTV
jgi:hypothetical protein